MRVARARVKRGGRRRTISRAPTRALPTSQARPARAGGCSIMKISRSSPQHLKKARVLFQSQTSARGGPLRLYRARIAAIRARRAIALVAPRTPPRAVVHAARFRIPHPSAARHHARRVHLRHARPRARLPRSRLARRSIVRRPARRRPSPRRARGSLGAAPRLRRVRRRADGREGRQGGDSLRRDSGRRRAVRLVPRARRAHRVHRGRRHDDPRVRQRRPRHGGRRDQVARGAPPRTPTARSTRRTS